MHHTEITITKKLSISYRADCNCIELTENETRNISITSKAMQYRQDIVTRVPITRVELITITGCAALL